MHSTGLYQQNCNGARAICFALLMLADFLVFFVVNSCLFALPCRVFFALPCWAQNVGRGINVISGGEYKFLAFEGVLCFAFEIILGACFVCRSQQLSSGHASQAARASHAASAVNLTSADAQARTAIVQVKSALGDVHEASDYFATGAPLHKVGRMALGQHARQVLRRAGKTEVASMLWDPLVNALTSVPSVGLINRVVHEF